MSPGSALTCLHIPNHSDFPSNTFYQVGEDGLTHTKKTKTLLKSANPHHIVWKTLNKNSLDFTWMCFTTEWGRNGLTLARRTLPRSMSSSSWVGWYWGRVGDSEWAASKSPPSWSPAGARRASSTAALPSNTLFDLALPSKIEEDTVLWPPAMSADERLPSSPSPGFLSWCHCAYTCISQSMPTTRMPSLTQERETGSDGVPSTDDRRSMVRSKIQRERIPCLILPPRGRVITATPSLLLVCSLTTPEIRPYIRMLEPTPTVRMCDPSSFDSQSKCT